MVLQPVERRVWRRRHRPAAMRRSRLHRRKAAPAASRAAHCDGSLKLFHSSPRGTRTFEYITTSARIEKSSWHAMHGSGPITARAPRSALRCRRMMSSNRQLAQAVKLDRQGRLAKRWRPIARCCRRTPQ